jgi:DNA-binding LacI/PurR family transcriptional regulator
MFVYVRKTMKNIHHQRKENKSAPLATNAIGRTEEAIRQWIGGGQLRERMRLPTEVEISRHVGVSRTSVRSALRALHHSGDITRSHSGCGWLVSDAAPRRLAAHHVATKIAAPIIGVVSDITAARDSTSMEGVGFDSFIMLGIVNGLTERSQLVDFIRYENSGPGATFVAPEQYQAWIATTDAMENDAVRKKLEFLWTNGAPVTVQYDTDEDLPFDRVVSDHAAGAALLTEWLYARGCRHILPYFPWSIPDFVNERSWLKMRRRGLTETFAKLGLPAPSFFPAYAADWGTATMEQQFMATTDLAYAYLSRAFAENPRWDAVMGITDGFVAAIKNALRRFPEASRRELPVVGYDDYWRFSPECVLTGFRPDATVDKNNYRLGVETVEVLAERLENPDRAEPLVRRVAPKLRDNTQ